MTRRVLLMILLIVLSIPAGTIGLMATESGSRWLLRQFMSALPVRASVAGIKGCLLDRLVLTNVTYQTDTDALTVAHLALSWQPSLLFSRTLKITELSLDGVNLSLSEIKEQPPESRFDTTAALSLPVQITIDTLLLTNMSISRDTHVYDVKKLQFSAVTDKNKLTIKTLTADTPEVQATVQGDIGLSGGFPLSLTAHWQFDAKNNGLWQGTTRLNGDIDRLIFDNQLATPFKLALQGSVEDVLNAPRLNTRGDWHQLAWPLTGTVPQIQSEQGHFELTGLLSAYQLSVNATLNQQYLSDAVVSFAGKGSSEAMAIDKLAITSASGALQLAGEVAWKEAFAFDLNARGQHFNPAIVLAALPGELNFNAHVKGNRAAGALQLDTDIKKLSGQLRGQPVSAQGKLLLRNEQLKVEALRVVSGVNQLALDGSLGERQAALTITLDMPKLESLWPTLGGTLKGSGQLRGAWQNPTVKFNAKAAHLRFGAHRAQRFAIDIDYHPENTQTSTLQLTASAINSGSLVISDVQIAGKGTPAAHHFTADLKTSLGDLSADFTGSVKANTWQGDVAKLTINQPESGRWQLNKNWLMRVVQKAPAVDITVDTGCLAQQGASLCLHGHYDASGDFDTALTTTALPLSLLQSYLPKNTALHGVMNGEAHLQRRKNALTGRYQLQLPPSHFITTGKTVALGTASLTGDLKADVVTANLNLALTGQDYIHSQLQMNLGKSQALSGQVTASLYELAILETFMPPVSDIKGNLQTDLNLQGTWQKPVINGRIDLVNGTVNTPQIDLAAVNLHALATGNNRLQLQGSATPTAFKTGSLAPLKIKTVITIDADIQRQKTGLEGHYRLAIPTNTAITIKNRSISVGASSLSGNIHGELIHADLDMVLIDGDYCRGNLLINTGKTQALSGQLNASISQFSVLEAFVPRLSKLTGLLTASVGIDGSLQQPQFNGGLSFSKGSADMTELGLGIRAINIKAFTAVGDPERLNIQGSAQSGTGQVKLDGFIKAPNTLALTLTGENFEVAKIPAAQIAVSPTLKILFAEGKGTLSGTVSVPKAIMTLQELPENAVTTSPDEVILGEAKVPETAAVETHIDTDIAVELGKQVRFSGQGLDTYLQGHLRIVTSDGKIAMNGNVDLNKATYKRFGQDLTVRKGRFLFNGPVDNPWLDVEAIRLSKSKQVTAVLSLSGTLQKPKTLISSEPSLPEADALAYLITGGSLSQVSKSQGDRVASAALSYGAGQVSWVAGKLGIDELALEEGETLQDTLVTVGQYLTPDFYVGTKVGLFNKQAVLVLKHKLTDKINLETQTGTSKRVKLNYEFDTN